MARRNPLLILLVVVAFFAFPRVIGAQQPTTTPPDAGAEVSDAPPQSYDTPPAITIVDGTARLVRQGQSQTAPPTMPLIEGDRLVTENGRIEVTFPDGSRLHIDRNTTVDFLSLSLMRLLDGRVILVAAGRGGERAAVDYQIDAQGGSTRVQTAGEYRVSMNTGEVELDVITGRAALATDQGSVEVEAGERSFARNGEAPAEPLAFNSARMDAFDQWSEQQRSTEVASQSTQYLPQDMSAYASDFDRYGRWENDTTYGYVWYPTVAADWRPYYNGYWDNIGPYGWTWIGYDRWAWPTHHWGRWGFRAGLWFWVPERHWGPAWVSWAYSPGYISWCPLDYYNRPLVSLFFGFGYRRAFYDPWLCWTVLPRHRFGHGYRVAGYAVRGDRLPLSERNGFVVRRGGPDRAMAMVRPGVSGRTGAFASATPRALGSVPMQARPRDSAFASSRAVPRGSYGTSAYRGSAGASTYATPRRDSRSLSYGPSARGVDRPGAMPRANSRVPDYPGAAVHRGEARPLTPYQNQPSRRPGRPSYSPGNDRPYATPRGGTYSAPPARGQQYSAPRTSPAPRDSAPSARPRGYAPSEPRSYGAPREYSAPRAYSAPSPRGQSYATPRYSAPEPPRYSQPSYSAPRYSAPGYSPRSSAPSYAAPRSAPSYTAPRSAPSYSAPSYSAPRPPSGGGYAAPRSGGGGGGPSGGSARPAPSGGSNRGGGRGRG